MCTTIKRTISYNTTSNKVTFVGFGIFSKIDNIDGYKQDVIAERVFFDKVSFDRHFSMTLIVFRVETRNACRSKITTFKNLNNFMPRNRKLV